MASNTLEDADAPPRCAVHGLKKRYGVVKALRGITVSFEPGEVHAILGENGAGKSTLMKILAGAETQDEGSVHLDGVETTYQSVKEANANGVAIVFQELSLFPELDVLSNLFLGREIKTFGMINRQKMMQAASPVLKELGLDVPLHALVSDIPLHERQLLEIAKALLIQIRVLILDEPTSSLSANETERLFRVIRNLRDRGVTILLVSHRLEEISAIADTVTVLRDGEHVKTVPMGSTTMSQLVTDMIGKPPGDIPFLATPVPTDDSPRLSVRGLSSATLRDVSLDVHQGEVFGIAGLEDAGVQEFLYTVFGLAKSTSGEMSFPDGLGQPATVREAVRRRIALVPADRRRDGLMLDDSVFENVTSVRAGVTKGFGRWLRRAEMNHAATASLTELQVKYGSLETPVRNLSGGNQQKIVLAKWLQVSPTTVLLDDPTRGVDLGAKLEIYEVIRSLAANGCTVLFNSSELEEYRHLCKRVAIFRRGRVSKVLHGSQVSEHNILHEMNA
jgi:ABC-type sugar transport system ATPase subunit